MDDLGDLAWKSMGFNAKPAVRSGSTPLNQLGGAAPSGASTPLGSQTPQQLRTPPSYSPGNSAHNTPRMAANTAASPFFAPQASGPTTFALGGVSAGAAKPRQFSSSSTPSANHSRSASPGPSSLLGGGGGAGKVEDVFGNLLSSMGGGFAAKPNLSGMTMDQQRRYHEEQRQQELQAQAQKAAGDPPSSAYGVTPIRPAVSGPSGGTASGQAQKQQSALFGAAETSGRSRTPSNVPANIGMSASVLMPQRPAAQGAPPPPVTAPSDAWNLDFLMGGSAATSNAAGQASGSPAGGLDSSFHDPFDICDLGKHLEQQNARSPNADPVKTQPEDDNPLGLLAQPVSAKPQKPARSSPAPSPVMRAPSAAVSGNDFQAPSRNPDLSPSTDNDFAIAQLVGMGYDDDSAAAALTASGNDLNLTIEILSQSRAAERELAARKQDPSLSEGSVRASSGSQRRPQGKPHRVAKFCDDYEAETSDDSDAAQSSRGPGRNEQGAAITQEKIIQTASAIGTSVFKNAKSMLAYSKQKITAAAEKAQAEMDRVYAERESGRGGRGPGAEGAPHGGRGRTLGGGRGGSKHAMGDYGGDGDEQEYGARESYQAFKDYSSDSDNEGASTAPAHRSHRRQEEFDREKHPPSSSQQPVRPKFIDTEDDAEEPPLVRSSAPQNRSFATQQSPQPSLPASRPVPTPAPAQPPPPPVVTATPAQLATSSGHKDAGNAHFKNGQFGDAEASYSLAISALPSGHLLLAALYNNRAAARLKTGHYREAAEDCGVVQSFDPRDVKSLLRRATAYEAMEKWADALEDYRKLMGIDPSVKTASDGLGRCQKALRPPAAATVQAAASASAAPVKPVSQFAAFEDPFQSTPASISSESAYVSNAVNAAVQKLREQNRAAENEDDQKLALKDQTDDLINRWRRGKEDNLRALLSSLDMVLWAELKWAPINLSELITPQQVKIRYMKAVGRVHPDKLQQSATVEHRLIANGVFGTLNKGWDAFKTQNGLN
ncbi:hypothetical protein HDU87_001622 [Geranomyces variabilis]|uniref:UBA domain-containing protein n=1 Tax=Geranomyces variabilis TaxID=109894 RepID=A0AAD5TP53_9FUNG|nr:hypothetical protein HDU87_001622 [Geranomyces variabilis]